MQLEGLVLGQRLWAEQSFVCDAISSYNCKHLAILFSEDFPVLFTSLHQFGEVSALLQYPELGAVHHSLLCHMGSCNIFMSSLPSWSPLTRYPMHI